MAIIGAVAVTRPMPKIRNAKLRLAPSAPAARKSGPSQPIMMTSVVASAICDRLVRTSGQASESVARSSAPHAPRGPVSDEAAMDMTGGF